MKLNVKWQDAEGRRVCVTVIEVGPCPVVQLKTLERDGYVAVQLGFGEQKAKRRPWEADSRTEEAGRPLHWNWAT